MSQGKSEIFHFDFEKKKAKRFHIDFDFVLPSGSQFVQLPVSNRMFMTGGLGEYTN
jgi:hypothetical protein